MESTANLELPYIMPSQAQKHVTHNEALAVIDAVVQLSVLDRDLDAPPAEPAEGVRYMVAAAATGAWEGWDDAIALWAEGGWHRIVPRTGWLAWVEDEGVIVRRTGTGWIVLGDAIGTPQELAMIGVGTTADAENPFAAKLNKALWTARYDGEGGDGDLRYTLNKEEPDNVLSLLMQSDWSGRAEIGLIGDDDLTIKVSPDGSSWKEAIRIDRDTGATSFPHTPTLTVVGDASEDDGVPTGAIIERGSNANGEYTRLADGTQLCWRDSLTLTGTSASNKSANWTFPAEFNSPPLVNHSVNHTDSDLTTNVRNLSLSSVGNTSTTTATVVQFIIGGQSYSTSDTVAARAIAIGRWF